MFRIFRSGYGINDIVPYHFGDGVMFLVFGLIAVLMMFWLAVAAAPVMYLPMLAILAGLLLLLYLGGEEGELRGKAAYYLAYPFFAYGWTGMCWAVFAASVPSVGLVGLLGWIVLGAVGVFTLVIPSFEVAEHSIGGLVLIPLVVLWVSAIVFSIGDENNTYGRMASNLVLYTFRVFGVLLLLAAVVYLITTVKELIDNRNTRINTVGGFLMLLAGCLPLAAVPLLSTILSDMQLAALLLGLYFVIALLTCRSKGPAPGAQFALLPVLLAWFMRALMPVVSAGKSPLVPLAAAGRIFGVLHADPCMYFAERIGGPSLEAFSAMTEKGLNWLLDLISTILGKSIPAFGLPDLFGMVLGFFLLLLVMWIGTLLREKISQ